MSWLIRRLGDKKTTGAYDLNDTRNDDQQAIVMKQEENQRSAAADIENKVLAASLETYQEEAVCVWFKKCIDMYVERLTSYRNIEG